MDRSDDEILHAISDLASSGEYLDQLPGKPGFALEGGGAFIGGPDGQIVARLYDRRSSEYANAKMAGWTEPLPPLTPAPSLAVEVAESSLGRPFPLLLRRLYLEVGNGGFGPGYGLIELSNVGTHSDPATRSQIPFLLCHWGCGITSELDLADGQVWGFDPNPAPAGVFCDYPQGITVAQWFSRWLDGTLYQPWLLEDLATGEWRGATDENYGDPFAES